MLYMPIDTDQLICIEGRKLPLTLTCADIGFTNTVSNNCFWPPCYTN
jgi:hypothetical protein